MAIGKWGWIGALLLAVSVVGGAQASPSNDGEIRLVIPFSQAGVTDVLFRFIAEPVSERLGRRILLENVPGAAATRGAQRVREAAPDGLTLLGSHQALSLSFLSGRSAHSVQAFVPVALLLRTINVPTTYAQHTVQTAAGFAEYVHSQGEGARDRPVRIGMIKGSTDHFFWMQFLDTVGVDLDAVQMVGYPDSVSQVAALVGREIDFSMLNLPAAGEMYEKGILRPLGVADDRPLPGLPGVSTLQEQGIDILNSTNRGVFAPLGTPRETLEPLAAAFAAVLGDDALVSRLEQEFGTHVDIRLFEEYATYLAHHIQVLASLADEVGFTR